MPHFKRIFLFFGILITSKSLAKTNNVFLCYGKTPVQEIINYEYVILEASHYSASEVALLKQHNTYVISYISLGEFNKYTSFYNEAKEFALSGKNEIWNSYFLDLSKKEMQQILLKDIKNKIRNKGFDGLFLDNIDNYGSFGKQKDLQLYLIDFLKTLKQQFPSIHLMQNAGLEIIYHTKSFINSIAVESVITNYNFESKKYLFRRKKEYKSKICTLKSIEKNHNIPLIIIEYTNKKKDRNKIFRKLRKHNWNVFIGQIDLQSKPSFK